MHILAVICGVWLHLAGDLGLCTAATLTAAGLTGRFEDGLFEFRSRTDVAFQIFPIPLMLAISGLILAHWGWSIVD